MLWIMIFLVSMIVAEMEVAFDEKQDPDVGCFTASVVSSSADNCSSHIQCQELDTASARLKSVCSSEDCTTLWFVL